MAKIGGYSTLSNLTDASWSRVRHRAVLLRQCRAHTRCKGLLVALYEREDSGLGQWVETTLVQGLAAHDTWNWIVRLIAKQYPGAFTAVPLRRRGSQRPEQPPCVPAPCRALVGDGRWLQFSQTSERLWVAFMRALGLEWMLDDPKWKDAATDDDIDVREAFWERMIEAVRTKTVAEWNQVFDDDPDVFAEIFRHGTELLQHPQMVHNRQVVSMTDPELGDVTQPGPLAHGGDPGVGPTVGAEAQRTRRGAPDDAHGARRRAPPATAPSDPPLAGVTIVELGTFYAAPFGTTLLTDYGARVIKVEQLDGDPMRWIMPFPEAGGIKVLQGKESVAVDVHTDAGREIVLRIRASRRRGAAVVPRRCRRTPRVRRRDPARDQPGPRVPERTGIRRRRSLRSPARVRADDRRGHRARAAQCRHFDPRARPTSRWTRSRRTRCDSVAAAMGVGHADGFSALGVATALALGLVARERGAPGQSMLTTMLNTVAHAISEDMVEYEGRGPAATADPEMFGLNARYRLYETAAGWVFLAAPMPREWEPLAAALAPHGGLADDDRFATEDDRTRNDAALADVLGAIFRSRPAAEWERDLTAQDVACVVSEEGSPDGLIMDGDDALGRTMDIVVDLEHPVIGAYPRLKPLGEVVALGRAHRWRTAGRPTHERRARGDRVLGRADRRPARSGCHRRMTP